jgi:hypothetical protein
LDRSIWLLMMLLLLNFDVFWPVRSTMKREEREREREKRDVPFTHKPYCVSSLI